MISPDLAGRLARGPEWVKAFLKPVRTQVKEPYRARDSSFPFECFVVIGTANTPVLEPFPTSNT